MSSLDVESAIDDSSPTIHFGSSIAASFSPSRIHKATPITNEGAQVYGPRSGHWTVSSGRNISAIDDGSVTLRHQGASSACLDRGRSPSGERRRLEPIGRATLRKLHAVKLAEEKFHPATQKARKDEVAVEGKGGDGADMLTSTRERSPSGISQATRRLFLPRTMDRPGIKISDRGGQSYVVREPSKASRSTVEKKPKMEQKVPDLEKTQNEQTRSAKTPLSSHQRSQSLARTSLKSNTHQVRIKGKNGEMAFVDLPVISSSSHSSSASRTHKTHFSAKLENDQEKQQDLAAKAARVLKTQRERQDLADLAANPVMSGALGGSVRSNVTDWHKKSSRNSPQASKYGSASAAAASQRSLIDEPQVPSRASQSKASSRTRTPASIHDIFDENAQVVSEKSSKTSVQSSQNRWEPASSEHLEDHDVFFTQGDKKKFDEPSMHQSSSKHKSNPASKHSYSRSRHGQHEPDLGSGTQSSRSKRPSSSPSFVRDPSAKKDYPDEAASAWGRQSGSRNSQKTFEHDFGGDQKTTSWRESPAEHRIPGGWDNISPSNRGRQTPPSLRSYDDSVSTSQSDPRQTIYAGHGWISPHPLSVASSYEPPQSAIRLPSRSGLYDEGPMLTYDEWMRGRRAPDSLYQSPPVRTLSDRTSSGAQGRGSHRSSDQSPGWPLSREPTLVAARENSYRASVASDDLRQRPTWSPATSSYFSESSQRSRPWYVQSDAHSSSRSSTFRAQGGAGRHYD